jgi:hypothetical protein
MSVLIDGGTSDHVTVIDEKMDPNLDTPDSAQARGKLLFHLPLPLWPDLLRCFISLCQHGHSNSLRHHYVSLTSSLTMAISTASVVCCLRSPNRISSSHLYRKFTYRECSRVPISYQNS